MMTDNKWAKYLFIFAILTISVLAVFWRELVDTVKDGALSVWSTDVVQEPMHDSDFSRIKEIRFARESNDISQIRVDDLRIVGHTDAAVVLSMKLTSRSSGNDYPSLRVAVLSGTGAHLRSIEVGPSDYAHGSVLIAETIELHVPYRPGDASFSVAAFYKE
jgi:hypothetical protein